MPTHIDGSAPLSFFEISSRQFNVHDVIKIASNREYCPTEWRLHREFSRFRTTETLDYGTKILGPWLFMKVTVVFSRFHAQHLVLSILELEIEYSKQGRS